MSGESVSASTIPVLSCTDETACEPKSSVGMIDTPADMFGKVMSIGDDLMPHYFEWGTEMPMAEVRSTLEARRPFRNLVYGIRDRNGALRTVRR